MGRLAWYSSSTLGAMYDEKKMIPGQPTKLLPPSHGSSDSTSSAQNEERKHAHVTIVVLSLVTWLKKEGARRCDALVAVSTQCNVTWKPQNIKNRNKRKTGVTSGTTNCITAKSEKIRCWLMRFCMRLLMFWFCGCWWKPAKHQKPEHRQNSEHRMIKPKLWEQWKG